MNQLEKIEKFIEYVKTLKGDEKGEAQVFCDRLFKAFGHDGYKEAGADLEYRVQQKKNTTKFADLLWGNRVLIEMKKRGSKLELHRSQAFDYWWNLRPSSPEYVILCNFDEFYIYNFSRQDEPLDKVKLSDLHDRYNALNFLFQIPKKPLFHNNLIDVTKSAADKVAKVFNRLIDRGEDRERVQRFILQIIFSMFAEDIRLLPYGFFTELINECNDKESAYDLLGGLFRQMASKTPARAGRYKDIEYFNGGLFEVVDPIELDNEDLKLLKDACSENWRKVHPAIFGTIFQNSMDEKKRHKYGAHYTEEIDIYKVVYPTIIAPWKEKINKAKKLQQLQSLRKEITKFQVLDPACGSGNFLYIAYRELKRLEIEIINKIHQSFGVKAALNVGVQTLVSPKQFHGMDINFFAVELAKATLMLAKELSIKEAENVISTQTQQLGLNLQSEAALPLDNLNNNIICRDALFTEWPKVDVIIGNPPYQSKNKMQSEFGAEYASKVRSAYPEVPGHADFCVYWLFKAHKNIKKDGFAGLVGTNTIRQNFSREGGLDYIVKNGGVIYNAVSSQKWSGEAAVHVSIVCWKKGEYNGKKLLYVENGDKTVIEHEVENINSSLSLNTDVTSAKPLRCNTKPKKVFQGQTHGHAGFLLSIEEGMNLLKSDPHLKKVIKPFLIGDELVSNYKSQPERFVIDFTLYDVNEAATFKKPFGIVKRSVLPDRKKKAEAQYEENQKLLKVNPKAKPNKHHLNFYNSWWKLSYGREDLLEELKKVSRYIACARVTQRPIFDFFSTDIRPNDKVVVFAFDDDYSFGIVQSTIHWKWFVEKCTTLGETPNYNSASIWDTFPWPQKIKENNVLKVAKAARELREERKKIMSKGKISLRELYRILEQPGKNPLKSFQNSLDQAVLEAYGFSKKDDILKKLLELNKIVFTKIENKELVEGPGLPSFIKNKKTFISNDYVKFEG